jgi:hypothetical protein
MEDAFGRYLAGMIYEELGEYSDAMISYRKAYQAYERQRKDFGVPLPHGLKLALLRMSQRMGLNDEHQGYVKRFDIRDYQTVAQRRKEGRVVFILGNGLAPKKQERSITVHDYQHGQVHRIALPYYPKRPQRILLGGLRLKTDDTQVQGSLVENVDGVAKKTLDEQLPGIKARALARAVAKNAMVRGAKSSSDDNHKNALLGLIANIATVATERADTRSWVTLPSEFYLASVSLPPGRYNIDVQFLGRSGGVVDSKEYKDIEVRAGVNQYHFYQWVSPADRTRK